MIPLHILHISFGMCSGVVNVINICLWRWFYIHEHDSILWCDNTLHVTCTAAGKRVEWIRFTIPFCRIMLACSIIFYIHSLCTLSGNVSDYQYIRTKHDGYTVIIYFIFYYHEYYISRKCFLWNFAFVCMTEKLRLAQKKISLKHLLNDNSRVLAYLPNEHCWKMHIVLGFYWICSVNCPI